MRPLLYAIAALVAASSASAGPVPADSIRWRLAGEEARLTTFGGRPARYLRYAEARLTDAAFVTGVIEFDVAFGTTQSFPGLAFRGQDDANYERLYFRPHESGQLDAIQYTPVFHGSNAWQIYYGDGYMASRSFRFDSWMHVRLEVADQSARLLIDGEPALAIPDLKRERRPGYLALIGGAGTYFADFGYEPGTPPAVRPPRQPQLPPGLVRQWGVSPALSEADAFATAADERAAVNWTPLQVETNGIANLARVANFTADRPMSLTRVTVESEGERTVRMRFGFSDKVAVFLNGTLLYVGEDSYQSRDFRFLGTVGLYDSLFLHLRSGANVVLLVVNESFGGGAAIAVFDDASGLRIKAP